jgi:hypothetical protein
VGEVRRIRGTTLAARPHVVAGVLLAACVLVYLWPVLVGGKILAPIADLYISPPWQGLDPPADLQRYYNPVLFDFPVVDDRWRVLVARRERQLIQLRR